MALCGYGVRRGVLCDADLSVRQDAAKRSRAVCGAAVGWDGGVAEGAWSRDQAQQVLNLFADRTAGGGIERLEMNLKAFRQVNRHQDDVQYAADVSGGGCLRADVLKNQGIDVPVSFLLTINKNFKPS